ncbi:hypothetical protein FGG08_004427 [Glutinoglossum americanum]|uniref:Retrograde regulation protein 2 n=1 Tax=Glutinoglossum americanum TaxID=1670608 RepID=A0A9P8I7M2_9PEZI|nr:hypothetical protein FGG08_004427 [Glutinoglossum americanum]
MATTANPKYWAIVDMGSNGIRFSITDLSPPTTRILPTVFQDRAAISLYDVQHSPHSNEKQPIPTDTISQVTASLSRFRTICNDFGVPPSQTRVLATAATRDAINSLEFRDAIQKATGWAVEMLPKEEEGRIGAMGVASSFKNVRGLVMDLGGGSTQITWMIAENGIVRTAKTAVSLPYGAAALTRRLEDANANNTVDALRAEISAAYRTAYTSLAVPSALSDGKFNLYLSGGGFRGWGYLLLSRHRISPYPIPIINGFKVDREDFENVSAVVNEVESKESVFRVSERRARQVPAVAFLVGVIKETIKGLGEVRFCQGGVREGALYTALPPEIRALPPLSTATAPYAPPSAPQLLTILSSGLPTPFPVAFTTEVLTSTINLLYYHGSIPKEGRASAGLNSTTTGILASAHGVSHENRALLALILCARWGSAVADPWLLHRLQHLIGDELSWWCKYIGQVAALTGDVFPAGKLDSEAPPRLALNAKFKEGSGKGDVKIKFQVRTREGDPETEAMVVVESIGDLEKPGKKKARINGWGFKIDVVVKRDL